MDLKEFITKWEGLKVDVDGAYGYQCTDFARQYCIDVFGKNYTPYGNAGTLFNQDWGDDYVKYENTADFLPLPGDICIFNGPTEAGHIGVVLKATLTEMEIIDQNTGSGNGDGLGNNAIRVHNYNYTEVIGFIRHITLIKKPMEKYGTMMIKGDLTYPSSIYGIPVRIAKTSSTTLNGLAYIKGVNPKATKDEILIFENTFQYGQDFLDVKLNHELFHFFQHLIFSDNQNNHLESYYRFIPNNVSSYAKTSFREDGAETYAYGLIYIDEGKELPVDKVWNDAIAFKYESCSSFVNRGTEKLIKLIEERKAN